MIRTISLVSLAILFWGPTVFAQGHSNPPLSQEEFKCESKDPKQEIDMKCIEDQLKGDGLGGWVHASVADQQMLVFTWRRPGNFFVNVQLPMASEKKEVLQQLLKLRRHDQIIVKGEFFENEAPIQHINVSSIKMVKAYDGPQEEYEYDPELTPKILKGTKLIGKVHIVANGGSVLVVETGDRVIPVFNKKPELVKDLYRNDKIELNYIVRTLPQRPSHLMVNSDMEKPVRVLERIEVGHGEEMTLKGPLVMFPKSPQIKFNVFALRQEDNDGVRRNFTIVNFENIDLFFEIRDKLQKTWDDYAKSAEYDRNKFLNRRVMLTIKGKKNLVSPDQANPQIIPSKIEDVKIEIQ